MALFFSWTRVWRQTYLFEELPHTPTPSSLWFCFAPQLLRSRHQHQHKHPFSLPFHTLSPCVCHCCLGCSGLWAWNPALLWRQKTKAFLRFLRLSVVKFLPYYILLILLLAISLIANNLLHPRFGICHQFPWMAMAGGGGGERLWEEGRRGSKNTKRCIGY